MNKFTKVYLGLACVTFGPSWYIYCKVDMNMPGGDYQWNYPSRSEICKTSYCLLNNIPNSLVCAAFFPMTWLYWLHLYVVISHKNKKE